MAVKKEVEKPDTYTKEQLLKSERYKEKRDILQVILSNKKTYTLLEVDETIEKFLKGKVN